jgi:hypothetical protein
LQTKIVDKKLGDPGNLERLVPVAACVYVLLLFAVKCIATSLQFSNFTVAKKAKMVIDLSKY